MGIGGKWVASLVFGILRSITPNYAQAGDPLGALSSAVDFVPPRFPCLCEGLTITCEHLGRVLLHRIAGAPMSELQILQPISELTTS